MLTTPQPEHAWLTRFIGNWAYDAECFMGQDQPPTRSGGTETVRPFGDLWIIAEGRGSFPGGEPMTTLFTLGFDPTKRAYVGSWMCDKTASLFTYQGTLSHGNATDAGGIHILPLDTLGPSWADPGKIVRYQDVIELHGNNERLLWSQVHNDDGSWTRFMTARYRRI